MADDGGAILIVEETQPPRTLTRADIVQPSRLQGFSDAVFATAATLLIIPVRKFELEDKESLKEALQRQSTQFIVFLLGYIVIFTIWESHLNRFKIIKKVDDFIVALNLVSLMVTTFLPFSISLISHYGEYQTSILLNCGLLLALELLEAVVFIYAFLHPRLLSEDFIALAPEEKKIKKRLIFGKIQIQSLLYILASIASLFSFYVSWILVTGLILTPLRKKIVALWTRFLTQCSCRLRDTSSYYVTGREIDKERIECFSDAAIAIVATLLILDLTAEDFPTKQEVAQKGLVKTLRGMYPMFISYVGTYTTIAFLWFINHSVLQHIKMFTQKMVFVNKIFLAFVALVPFLSTLTNKYSGHTTYDARIAVGFSSLILFFGSFSNVVLFVFALWDANHTLYDWAQPRNEGNHALVYLTLKTLIIPVLTFFTFMFSLSTDSASYWTYHVALFAAPVLFILLKLGYACHWKQDSTPTPSPVGSREGSIVNVPVVNVTPDPSSNEGL